MLVDPYFYLVPLFLYHSYLIGNIYFPNTDPTFLDVQLKEQIMSFLDTKIKPIAPASIVLLPLPTTTLLNWIINLV
jgi:hypothetical protein